MTVVTREVVIQGGFIYYECSLSRMRIRLKKRVARNDGEERY